MVSYDTQILIVKNACYNLYIVLHQSRWFNVYIRNLFVYGYSLKSTIRVIPAGHWHTNCPPFCLTQTPLTQGLGKQTSISQRLPVYPE